MLGEGRDIRALMMRMIRAGLSISLSFFMGLIAASAVRIVTFYHYGLSFYQQKKRSKHQSLRDQKYQRAMARFRDNADDVAHDVIDAAGQKFRLDIAAFISSLRANVLRWGGVVMGALLALWARITKFLSGYQSACQALSLVKASTRNAIKKALPDFSHLEFRRDDRQKAMLMMISFCIGVFLVFSFGMHEGETSPALQAKLIDNPADINGKNAGHGANLGFGGFKLDLSAAHDVDDLRHLIARYPDAIIGMPASHLANLFDVPAFVHQVDDVAMWQFSSDKCVIDVYFLGPDLGANMGEDAGQDEQMIAGQIAHMDVRSRNDRSLVDVFDVRDHDQAISSCLSSVMRGA